MPSPTCSEKLLRDTLLRDERERQQQQQQQQQLLLLSNPQTRPLLTRRRYSHTPTSSDLTRTQYARSSSLFRTAMSTTTSRSPSSSSSSEQDRQSPVRKRLFYRGSGSGGADNEARPQQQSPTHRTRRNSSTSPSPLRMKRRQESVDLVTANFNSSPTNVTNLRRNQSLQNTQHNRYGSAHLPAPSHGPSERSDTGSNHIMMRARYGNEARDEHSGWPGKRGRPSIRSGSESIISESFSALPSSHSQSASQTPTRTPNRAATSNNQYSPYYSPLSPHTSYSGVGASSPSFRSQTNAIPNTPSPRRNNSSPSALPVPSLKPTKRSPEAARLPTPPPSPHTSANYSQRKKEGGLELRIPGQGPAVARKTLVRKDATITQQTRQVPTGPKNNADGHSLTSSESCSTRTSVSSVSHLHVGCSCSSHSSLDEPLSAPPPPSPPPRVSEDDHHHHLVQQSQSTRFNARKASTQCRAMEGYVSFANVEGLGEPPLVRDEYDEDVRGQGRKGSVGFLPMGVLNAAFGWKRFLGGGDSGGPGVEGPVVVR